MNNLTPYKIKSNYIGYSIIIENDEEVLDLILNDIVTFSRNKKQIQLIHKVHGELILKFKTEQNAIDSYNKLEIAINGENITEPPANISNLYFTFNIYDNSNITTFPCLVFITDKLTQTRTVEFEANSSIDLVNKLNTKYNNIGTFSYNPTAHYLTMTYTEDTDVLLLPQTIQFLDSYTNFISNTSTGNFSNVSDGENYLVNSLGNIFSFDNSTIASPGTTSFKWYYTKNTIREITINNFANLTVGTSSRVINEINKFNLFSTVLLNTSYLNKSAIKELNFNSVTTLDTFDFANLSNLKILNTYSCICSNSSLLNFSDCTNLQTFSCTYTSITDIDLSMANLQLFIIQENLNINNLIINNCKELSVINCYNFNGTNFIINGDVEKLYIFKNNSMTSLPELISSKIRSIIIAQNESFSLQAYKTFSDNLLLANPLTIFQGGVINFQNETYKFRDIATLIDNSGNPTSDALIAKKIIENIENYLVYNWTILI